MPASYQSLFRYDEIWESKFQLLLDYQKLYGTVDVPNRILNLETPEWERRLGSWVNTQRQSYKKGKLLQWRYDRLISADFDFDPFDTRFERHFTDFLTYKIKYGHALVPQDCNEYPSLGSWVSHMRCKPQSEERRERLNKAGFIWSMIDEYWQIMFRELIAFKQIHGHFKVSEKRSGSEKLGTWVVRMRKAKRYGIGQNLSEEQIKLLDSIGFDWDPAEADWNRNYKKLLKFIDENDHCLVPLKRCKIEGLGWWVYWLRKNKHKLSENQISQLDSVGFEWNSDIAYRKRNNIKT